MLCALTRYRRCPNCDPPGRIMRPRRHIFQLRIRYRNHTIQLVPYKNYCDLYSCRLQTSPQKKAVALWDKNRIPLVYNFMKYSNSELITRLEKCYEIWFERQGLTHTELDQPKIKPVRQNLIRNHQQAYIISSKYVPKFQMHKKGQTHHYCVLI